MSVKIIRDKDEAEREGLDRESINAATAAFLEVANMICGPNVNLAVNGLLGALSVPLAACSDDVTDTACTILRELIANERKTMTGAAKAKGELN